MENNSYKLTIVFDGEGSNSSNAEKKAKDDSDKTTKAIMNVAKTQVIKPFISTAENVYLNNLQMSTGSSQLVERQRFMFDGIRQGISLYQSAQGGIAFASAIGLGAGAGAGIGIALFAVNTLLNLYQQKNEIDNQRKIENVNIDYQRTRMGIANNKSRTGA